MGMNKPILDAIQRAWEHDMHFPYASEWDPKQKRFIFRYVDGRVESLTRSEVIQRSAKVESPLSRIQSIGIVLEHIEQLQSVLDKGDPNSEK